MNRFFRASALGLVTLVAGAIAAPSFAQGANATKSETTTTTTTTRVYVDKAPPAPKTVTVTVAPKTGFVWSPGYWKWDNSSWVWVDGSYLKVVDQQKWVAPTWVQEGNRWYFVEGHWE